MTSFSNKEQRSIGRRQSDRAGDIAKRILNLIDNFDKRVAGVSSMTDGLSMVMDAIRAEFPELSVAIEISNPTDSEYYGSFLAAGDRGPSSIVLTHGRISTALGGGGEAADGPVVGPMPEVGALADCFREFDMTGKPGEEMLIGHSPIIVSGFVLGHVIYIWPGIWTDEPGHEGNADRLINHSALLMARLAEQLMLSTGMRSAEARRQTLEERILKSLSHDEPCTDDDLLEYVATLASPFGPARRLIEMAGALTSVGHLFQAETDHLPREVQPIITVMREIQNRGKWKLIQNQTLLECWSDLIEYCKDAVGRLKHEEGVILLLDEQCRVLQMVRMFRGTYNNVQVWPREVVRTALNQGASNVVLIHNHPNGEARPSESDVVLTSALKAACASPELGLTFVDHLIFTADDYYSFEEQKLRAKAPPQRITA